MDTRLHKKLEMLILSLPVNLLTVAIREKEGNRRGVDARGVRFVAVGGHDLGICYCVGNYTFRTVVVIPATLQEARASYKSYLQYFVIDEELYLLLPCARSVRIVCPTRSGWKVSRVASSARLDGRLEAINAGQLGRLQRQPSGYLCAAI